MTEEGRLAILEYKSQEQEKQITEINGKLDELLALRQKGMGAFWLATSLAGIVFSMVFSGVFSFIKG